MAFSGQTWVRYFLFNYFSTRSGVEPLGISGYGLQWTTCPSCVKTLNGAQKHWCQPWIITQMASSFLHLSLDSWWIGPCSL